MWPFTVTVLPRQAGAGDWRPLPLAAGISAHVSRHAVAWRAVAAAVGVQPGQKVCLLRRPLVEAVVARHGTAPAAHLNEHVALGLVACD